jgi:hypothetical protein
VNFGAVDGVWVVTGVDAHAKLGTGLATEHLTFSGYTFPATLPDSTF